jgi:hypothetical protein
VNGGSIQWPNFTGGVLNRYFYYSGSQGQDSAIYTFGEGGCIARFLAKFDGFQSPHPNSVLLGTIPTSQTEFLQERKR